MNMLYLLVNLAVNYQLIFTQMVFFFNRLVLSIIYKMCALCSSIMYIKLRISTGTWRHESNL